MCSLRVSTTPQGMGQPSILWPDTEMLSISFSNDTSYATSQCSTNGTIKPASAPSQWM